MSIRISNCGTYNVLPPNDTGAGMLANTPPSVIPARSAGGLGTRNWTKLLKYPDPDAPCPGNVQSGGRNDVVRTRLLQPILLRTLSQCF